MDEKDKKKYIIDASYIISLLLPDEKNKEVDELFIRFQKDEVKLYSTRLLPFEVINGLKSANLSDRIDSDVAKHLIERYLAMNILFLDIELSQVFHIAVSKKLSVYDAAYLYLSQTTKFSLLTLDKHLKTK